MSGKSFEHLRVYHLSEQLADGIWDMVQNWPMFARDTLGKQIVRSADGIGANISEGYGRGSFQDNRRFIHYARGSLCETRHWLRRAFRRRLLSEEQVNCLKSIVKNLGPQLNAYLKSIGRLPKSPSDLPEDMTND